MVIPWTIIRLEWLKALTISMAVNGLVLDPENKKPAPIFSKSRVVTCWRKRKPIRGALAAARPFRYQDMA